MTIKRTCKRGQLARVEKTTDAATREWVGEGYYSVDGHKGAAFCDSINDLARLIRTSSEPIGWACESVRFHGCGMVPDECIDPDVNVWCDIDDEEFEPCYDGDAAFLVDEIATCKAIGDAGGTRAAIDALVSYIDGEE